MASNKLLVERRSQGDYAVRKAHAQRACAVTATQAEAIDVARKMNPGTAPDVERVRDTSVSGPDKWRKA